MFTAASALIRTQGKPAAGLAGDFAGFLARVRDETAQTSTELTEMMAAQPGQAAAAVGDFFTLGRLAIGHHRSFYASGFDASAGKFGGEWALGPRM